MKPMWLEMLLAEKFFTTCTKHDCQKKNEKNVFCLECMVSICQHCLSDHDSHQLLQIRRYVYHDVIRLHDIQKLLDCSRVQAYTINSARVVFLKERPQPKSNKGLGGNCEWCERSLQDAYRFCSVACKVDMSFATRPGGTTMESVKCDTYTTSTHQTTRCELKLASCQNGVNLMDDEEWVDLDLTTSTTSSESIRTVGSSSISTRCSLNMRSMSFAACTTSAPILLTKPHHLACNYAMRTPRHPHPTHQRRRDESLGRLNPSGASFRSTFKLTPNLLSKRRKCNKPHRSPIS
ncbi:hypothetical protein L7F22_068739 [Adiantum nelumboides]|nr:hypothetical protein [Adiantum nelumboides]